jgi:hypothetical protein
MAPKNGWKSPDPAKKRRKAKAKAHRSPKPVAPKQPLKTTRELQAETRELSLLATGRAVKMYEPTHYAPEPMPGVVLSGRRKDGRKTFEAATPRDVLNQGRNKRKTTAQLIAQRVRRNSVRFKRARSAARLEGTYDPTSVGKPKAFRRKTNTPRMLNWRAREVAAKYHPLRIRTGRRGQVIVVPATRKSAKDQLVMVVPFTRAEAYRVGKNARYNKRFWGAHTKEEFDEPTGKYTAQYVLKKEWRKLGQKREVLEEIYKEFTVDGKTYNRKVGVKYGKVIKEFWGWVTVEEKVENFRPKTQRKVRVIRTGTTDYSKTTAVKMERVNPDRLERRAEKKASAKTGKMLRGKKREKAAKLTLKAAA